jgi:hypothetical protein
MESDVIHVVSRHLADWTALLEKLEPNQTEAREPQLNGGVRTFHSPQTQFRHSKSDVPAWTNSLKSRDFR